MCCTVCIHWAQYYILYTNFILNMVIFKEKIRNSLDISNSILDIYIYIIYNLNYSKGSVTTNIVTITCIIFIVYLHHSIYIFKFDDAKVCNKKVSSITLTISRSVHTIMRWVCPFIVWPITSTSFQCLVQCFSTDICLQNNYSYNHKGACLRAFIYLYIIILIVINIIYNLQVTRGNAFSLNNFTLYSLL